MKKLQKNPNPEMYRGGFLTRMDYAATGEGRTIELNFCYADTKEEAKQKHLDRFCPSDPAAQEYFGVGVEVLRIESKKAKSLLEGFFKFGKGLHKDLVKAGIEFHLKIYVNYS
jgi:hypothetical protein